MTYTDVFVTNCGSQWWYTYATTVFYHKYTNTDMQTHKYERVCQFFSLTKPLHDQYTNIVQAETGTHTYVSIEYKRMTNCSASSQALSKSCVCTKTHKWIDANARRYQPGLTTRATSDNMHHFFQVSTYNMLRNEPMTNFIKNIYLVSFLWNHLAWGIGHWSVLITNCN